MNNPTMQNLSVQRQIRIQVSKELEKIAVLLEKELGLQEESRNIKSRARELSDGKFRVLVMGEFSSGKSTLLNALLGAHVLPINTTPTTAIITLISYGEEPKVIVYYKNGDQKVFEVERFREEFQLDIQDSEFDQSELANRFENIQYARLIYPIESLKDEIELVDSPGLNESRIRTETTHKFLPSADAVIFVCNALKFYSATEEDYLENEVKNRELENIFFAINQWDLLDVSALNPEQSKQDVLDRARVKLKPFYTVNGQNLYRQRVHTVNSLGALKAKLKQPVDSMLYEKSGMSEFENELNNFLEKERGEVMLRRALSIANLASKESSRKILEARNAIAIDVERLKENLLEQKPRLEKMRAIIRRTGERIDSVMSIQESQVVLSLLSYTEDIKRRITIDIKSFETSKKIGFWKMVIPNKQKEIQESYKKEFRAYFEKEYREWGRSISAEVNKAFTKLDQELGQDVEEFLELGKTVSAKFSATPEIEPSFDESSQGGAVERLATTGLSLLLLEPSGIVASALGVGSWQGFFSRWIQDMLIFNLVTSVIGGPWGLLAYLAIEITRGWHLIEKAKSSFIDNIGNKVSDEVVVKVRNQEPKIRLEIRKGFDAYRNTIMDGLNQKLADLQSAMNDIIKRKEATDYNMKIEIERLQKAEEELKSDVENIKAVMPKTVKQTLS